MEAALPQQLDHRCDDRYDARYDGAAQAALGRPGVRAPPAWMRPRLPPSIRETMRAVALLEGGLPDALAAHYLDAAPRALVEQRLGGDDPSRALLWRPIDPARAPGLVAALDGACAILRASGLPPASALREFLSAAGLLQIEVRGLTSAPDAVVATGRAAMVSSVHEVDGAAK